MVAPVRFRNDSGHSHGYAFLSLAAFDRNPPAGTAISTRKQRHCKRHSAIAIPITISSGVLALTNFTDTALVMRRLRLLPVAKKNHVVIRSIQNRSNHV